MRCKMLWVLLMVSCGAESTYLGNGQWSVECRRSRGNCYEEAAYVCPHGFDVIDADDQRGAFITSNGDTATVMPTYKGQLLIRCRGGH